MSNRNSQHMAGYDQDAGKQTTLRNYAEARTGRPSEMTRDTELLMTHTRPMKTQRWQHKNVIQ